MSLPFRMLHRNVMVGNGDQHAKGTLALSWGPWGGFYLHRQRVCLGWVALTYLPNVEIDDLMKAYVE